MIRQMKNFLKSIAKSMVPSIGRDNESLRDEWLSKTLAKLPKGSRILDAGAGTQQYRKYCSHLKYVSQDFGEYDGQGDNKALQTGKFDYGKLDIEGH